MTSSPLSIFKGSLDSIKEKMPDIIDGQLFFAVDTKQIYLDYNVDNVNKKSEIDLFSEFYLKQNNIELDSIRLEIVNNVIKECIDKDL